MRRPARKDWPGGTARMLPLSGKSENALRELADSYLEWLDKHAGDNLSGGKLATDDNPAAGDLADLAWTAGVGRSHFQYRAGVTFKDSKSLRAGLKALTKDGESRPNPDGYQGGLCLWRTGQPVGWHGPGVVSQRAGFPRRPGNAATG